MSAGLFLKKYDFETGLDLATNIRKNLASKSTRMKLEPEDREHLMNFMGHSEKIHKNIHRQHNPEKNILIMP